MSPPPGDRRHLEEAGFYLNRRHYSLSKIGKGLITFAMVAGVVGGCFAYAMNLLGRRVVPIDEDFRRITTFNDSVSLVQRNYLMVAVDSLHVEVRDLQEQVALVGLTSCAQLKADAPDWLKEKCRSVLRKEGR